MTDSQSPRFPSFPLTTGDNDPALRKYLDAIYDFAEQSTKRNIEWYSERAGPNSKYARVTRFGAITFVALAGLTPLLIGTGALPTTSVQIFTQISYIFIGLAAFLIGIDKFFGYSSTWMRYMTAKLTLQKHLAKFQYDWAILSAGVCNQLNPGTCAPMIQLVQKFALDVQSEIEKETSEWATELRSNLAEIEKTTKEKSEAIRPGSVSLKIVNAEKTKDGVSVSVDGKIVTKGIKNSENPLILTSVSPGEHPIQISGVINDKAVTAAKTAQVSSDQRTELELMLEIPKTA